MSRLIAVVALVVAGSGVLAQSPAATPKFDSFEVATIKPVDPNAKASRFITMQGSDRFVEKDYTLKLLIAAAYSLNPQTVTGGPGWMESDHFDITAVTPGEVRPTHDEQMAMLRSLLSERFKLTFHRQQKELPIYALEVAKGGPKLNASAAAGDVPPTVGPAQVFPKYVSLPARNATIGDFATLMQRAILDKPVVDRTELAGRYDFDLQWAPDETQFGGELKTPTHTESAPLFSAIQGQLGLRLVATKGPVQTLVVDKVEKPSEN
jgi:uncharacterized protein (TIGR03435 family)